jgi:hypothetical protein
MNDFMTGLKQGFRPFRPACQRAGKGLLIFVVGLAAGLLASVLGAPTLAGGLILFSTIVGSGYFVLAWIDAIRYAIHNGKGGNA